MWKEGTVKLPVKNSNIIKQCHNCQGQGTVQCETCLGEKKNKCTKCQGTGSLKKGDVDSPCRCKSGYIQCSTCKSKGRTKCTMCHQKKLLRFYLEVTVTFVVTKDSYLHNPSKVKKSDLECSGSQVIFTEEKKRIEPIQKFMVEKICTESSKILLKQENEASTGRIICQQQRLLQIPITRINYSINKEKYNVALYGNDHKVFAKTVPGQQRCTIQ